MFFLGGRYASCTINIFISLMRSGILWKWNFGFFVRHAVRS